MDWIIVNKITLIYLLYYLCWGDSLCRTAVCVVCVCCSVLTTVNVGVAVAVTRSRIVLTSQALSTIGLPEHPEHLFLQLNIQYIISSTTTQHVSLKRSDQYIDIGVASFNTPRSRLKMRAFWLFFLRLFRKNWALTCGSGQTWSMKGREAAISPHCCSQTGPADQPALWQI